MKNWLLPVAVLGLSGVGLVCASERGREQVRGWFERLMQGGDPIREFGKLVDEQLEAIQQALDTLAEALDQPERDQPAI